MTALTIQLLDDAAEDLDHIEDVATSTLPTATDRVGNVKQTVAGAVATIASTTNRGAWVTATAYALKDLVSSGGAWYFCVQAHTSGATFAGDSTKWRVYQGTVPSEVPFTVATYSALRSYAGDAFAINVSGYLVTAAPEGIAGLFTRDDNDTTSADNGGTIIVASNGKRWKRVYSGFVNVRWFGATGDGTTDDYVAMQAALDVGQYKTVYFPRPSAAYITSQSLNYKTQTRILGDGIGTFIRASPTWAASVPSVTPGTYSPTLSFAPLLYNAAPIQWWAIEGICFDGNDQDCYGVWLMENFYGAVRDVYVINTNKRPYTNIRGQSITHETFVAYDCGDGVLSYDNTNFKFIGSGFERLAGTWSYDQRQPSSFAKGGVHVDDCWFESDSSRIPTQGFLRMSGRRNRAQIHGAFHTTATTERILELNDTTDSVVVDGITMGAQACVGGEFTVNNASGAMLITTKAGATHNTIRGFFTAAKVDDNGVANTFDVNGSLATPVQHITGRFQVRYGDSGSGIPITAANYVFDADYNGGNPIIRLLGNAGNTLDLNSGKLRLTSALGQDYVATSGGISWTAANYVFNGASGATGYTKPLYLGTYSLWVDSTGDLRIKSGVPASDTDGAVVGTQT